MEDSKQEEPIHRLKDAIGLKRMQLARWVVLVTLVGQMTSLTFPSVIPPLGLPSRRPIGIQHLYGLFTHPLVQVGLLSWLWCSVQILLIAWLVTRALSFERQILLAVISLAVGGISYEILGPGEMFIGTGMLIAGMDGVLVIWGVFNWKSLYWPWKLFVVYTVVCFLFTPFVAPWRFSFLFAAIAGGVLALYWFEFKPLQPPGNPARLEHP